MSESGLALCEYTWGKYVFEETHPKEYIFTIEPLISETFLPINKEYIEGLKEKDIEVIGGSRIWLYLRKKADCGSFGKQIEVISRINYYKRDYNAKRVALIFFWIAFIINGFVIFLLNDKINLIVEIIGIPLGILCTLSMMKVKKRITELLDINN